MAHWVKDLSCLCGGEGLILAWCSGLRCTGSSYGSDLIPCQELPYAVGVSPSSKQNKTKQNAFRKRFLLCVVIYFHSFSHYCLIFHYKIKQQWQKGKTNKETKTQQWKFQGHKWKAFYWICFLVSQSLEKIIQIKGQMYTGLMRPMALNYFTWYQKSQTSLKEHAETPPCSVTCAQPLRRGRPIQLSHPVPLTLPVPGPSPHLRASAPRAPSVQNACLHSPSSQTTIYG